MGLDMFLSKRTYVKNWNHMNVDELHEVTVKKNGENVGHVKSERISYVIEEVMYWRKANAIHSWFVKNVQKGVDDCQEAYVSYEDLEALADLCEKVVKDKNPELMPPQSGFFFGGTEADEWYYKDCEETAKVLRELLAEEMGGEYYYQSSW